MNRTKEIEGNPQQPFNDDSDLVVSVEKVSKKFCKSLKRSMYYGISDLAKNLVGIKPDFSELKRDEFWAVRDVSLKLKKGDALGIIGLNGSGKTTLLRMLAGIFPPDDGKIAVKGRVGSLIAVGAGFHPHMTGRENIYLNGAILGMNNVEIETKFEEIVDFAEIHEFLDAPVSTYSSGMRVRLGFAIAVQIEPDLMLIDEILSVGDAGFRGKCINAVDKIIKNAAVVFVSHRLSDVARVCTKIMVMDHGAEVYQSCKVAEGIEIYYSQLGHIDQIVSGSGNAEIHEIRIFTHPDKPDENDELRVSFLSDLFVDVTFSISEGISKAILNISFMTRDMLPIAQCYSKSCDFEIENNGKHIRTRLKLPRLQFNPGIYLMAVTIIDESRGELLTRKDAAKTIQVVGSFIGNTPVQLIGEWQHIQVN